MNSKPSNINRTILKCLDLVTHLDSLVHSTILTFYGTRTCYGME